MLPSSPAALELTHCEGCTKSDLIFFHPPKPATSPALPMVFRSKKLPAMSMVTVVGETTGQPHAGHG